MLILLKLKGLGKCSCSNCFPRKPDNRRSRSEKCAGISMGFASFFVAGIPRAICASMLRLRSLVGSTCVLILLIWVNESFLAHGQTVTNGLITGSSSPTLAWDRSTNTMVTGYYVNYGELALATTHVEEAGNTNSFT
jgi:hypothetical protein